VLPAGLPPYMRLQLLYLTSKMIQAQGWRVLVLDGHVNVRTTVRWTTGHGRRDYNAPKLIAP